MAAADVELALFVKEALMHGASREEIKSALVDAGWAKEQVHAALSSFADQPFPVPIPRPRPYLSARDAFLYLVLFSMLGMSAYFLGMLIFQLIDVVLPDPAQPANIAFLERQIRWAISVLVISFPIYLYLAVRTTREVSAEPAKGASRIRKWLTYIALFVAALIIAGDLIALVFQFLTGALTTQVALKVITVAAISGAIFVYYLRSVSGDEAEV